MDAATLAMAGVNAAKRYGPTRRAGYSFGGAGGNGGTTAYTEVAMRLPFRLPVSTKRFRVHIRNYDYKGDTTSTGTLSFTGLYVGEQSLSTSTGSPDIYTGAFTGTPVTIDSAFSVVDSTEYISPWITAAGSQITGHKSHLLSMGFTCPAATNIFRTFSCMYFSANTAGDAAKAGQTATLGSYFASPSLLDVWIEYEYAGANPLILHIGDSLVDGRTATVAGINPHGQDSGYPQQHARRGGSVALVNAYSGITAGTWALTSSSKWTKYDTTNIVPDAVVVHLLTNDLGNNTDSVATMETNYSSIVNKIRALYGNAVPIYASTIMPRGFTGTQETNRGTLNAWLRNQPRMLAGCFDFDRAVRSAATPASLDADFDSGDTLHLSVGGYARLADVMTGRPLTRNPA